MAVGSIEQLVRDRYDDAEVEEALLSDIARSNTAARILSGELVLPGLQDAVNWHNRITGRLQGTATERALDARVRALEQLVRDLTVAKSALEPDDPRLNPNYVAALEERIRELTAGDQHK